MKSCAGYNRFSNGASRSSRISDETGLKTLVAANASPMTLDGTRTYLLGHARVAIIDPGPLLESHLDAVAEAVGDGIVVSVLLTHSHPDHAEGAHELAARVQSEVKRVHRDDLIETDEGSLRALHTPGHTPDHFSYWWQSGRALFCGDLMMGGMDTALVARPEGNLRDYLASLRAIDALAPKIIYPAHGDPFLDPHEAIARYIAHREERIAQVIEGLKDGPLSADDLLSEVYGSKLDPHLRHYAETAIEAYLDYLRTQNRVRESAGGTWSLT
jgi:glyoxylase-like metal-dependent hydrolase (beta-lactamase superfamily II)